MKRTAFVQKDLRKRPGVKGSTRKLESMCKIGNIEIYRLYISQKYTHYEIYVDDNFFISCTNKKNEIEEIIKCLRTLDFNNSQSRETAKLIINSIIGEKQRNNTVLEK